MNYICAPRQKEDLLRQAADCGVYFGSWDGQLYALG